MNDAIKIIIFSVILIVSVAFAALLNLGAGRRRDWQRDDTLQEEAIKKMKEMGHK